jgi:hypothetical protein
LKASFKPYADCPKDKLGKRIVFMAAVKMLLSLSFAEKRLSCLGPFFLSPIPNFDGDNIFILD